MDFSTILHFIKDNYSTIISACFAAVFLVVNIIQAIRTHDVSKLKEALLYLPEVISNVEKINVDNPLPSDSGLKGVYKKTQVETVLMFRYGSKFFKKYKDVFSDAIEDILNTPQKKGGPVDVSQTNEEK